MQTVSLPIRALSGNLEPDLEIFVIGDVHGQAEVLQAVLSDIDAVPRVSGRSRALVFLGDLIDRGPDSIGAVNLALTSAEAASADQVILLPGNHELILTDVLEGYDPELWLLNGGRTVMSEVDPDWKDLSWDDALQKLQSAFPGAWIDCIKRAPSHATFGDLLFIHAGVDPKADRETFLDRNRDVDDLHWATIRHEFTTWDKGWNHDDGGNFVHGPTVIVHGHTPAIRTSLTDRQDELPLMDGIDEFRAICLDAGAAYRPQIGWARFWPDRTGSNAQISATFVT